MDGGKTSAGKFPEFINIAAAVKVNEDDALYSFR